MITAADVKDLLTKDEGESLAFIPESTKVDVLTETMAALANGAGGYLIIGVAKSGKLKGLADSEATIDRAIEAALACDPPLLIPFPKSVQIGQKTVVVVEVPAGLPYVFRAGQSYPIRTGAENNTLTTRQLRRLMLARGQTSFDRTVVAGAGLDDLDWQKAEQYVVNTAGLMAESIEDALLKRACLVMGENGRPQPTQAGLLLFGREPRRFIPAAEIIVVRYAGLQMSDEFVREDIGGPLPDQVRRAEAFVVSNLERSHQIEGLARRERLAFPLDAVRELIVNAVAHRDYSIDGDTIRLFIFADRLECYSPGRLPGHITVDNILEERFSRNPAIVQVLSDMGFIERLGYGIDRIVRRLVEEGLPSPQFEETTAGFKVTLSRQPRQWQPYHGAADQTIRAWLEQGLNERQIKAMNFVMEHGRITNSDYSTLCPDVSTETLRRDLANLVEQDLLLRIGEKRATYYILK